MRRPRAALVFLAGLLSARASAGGGPYPIEEKIPQAKESYYSARICGVLKHWPPEGFPEGVSETEPLWIAAIKTPGDDAYVGLAKRMWIRAPLSAVASLMTDFEGYKDRVPDLKEVRVLGRDGNRITMSWRSKSPMLFVPDTRYAQVWVIDESSPGRVVCRHQLEWGNHLKFSDGLIVMEAAKEKGLTRLTTFDFFKLDLGVLAKVAPLRQVMRKVWKDSVEAYYRGDIALKTKAEHPDWTAGRIQEEAQEALKAHPAVSVQFLSPSPFD